MSEGFATIDVIALELVCGGEGDNSTEVNFNVGVTVPKEGGNVQVGVQGGYKETESNYSVCVDNYRRMGGTVDGLRAACGLPNGQP